MTVLKDYNNAKMNYEIYVRQIYSECIVGYMKEGVVAYATAERSRYLEKGKNKYKLKMEKIKTSYPEYFV